MRGAFPCLGFLCLACAGCGGGGSGASLPSGITQTPTTSPSSSPTPNTIPFWQSSFTYAGTTYPFTMVGTDPSINGTTTVVSNTIVPVQFHFSDGTVLEAGTKTAGLLASPLYVDAQYAAGTTQYGDAVMRSEFWKYAATENYHVLLGTPVVEPPVVVQVPASDGYTTTSVTGVKNGFVTFDWFIEQMEPQIIAQLGIQPTSFTIFATYGTEVLEPPNNACCYIGYHASFPKSTASGREIFTTAWASISSSSVEALSHEVAEWFNDPFYTNDVPKWLQPGSTGCGFQLEVGDPVAVNRFVVGNYVMQDEAFYSWFSRDVPSIGINGQYDLMGKLAQPSSPCPHL